MRELLQRRDGPAIRDTLLWFALIIGSGVCGFMLWGTWWAVIPFMIYGVLYASTSDSRWHEPSHGTAFKTDWMNNALYEIASFMVLRESTRWRWSHARHHSDTIIVGRDPEIAVTRPPNWSHPVLAILRHQYDLQLLPQRPPPLHRPAHCGGEDLHSGIGVWQSGRAGLHLPRHLRERHRPCDLHAAASFR